MILWSKKIYPFYFCTVTSYSSLNSAQEFILQYNYLCKCARYPDILQEIVGYPSNVYFWGKIILAYSHSFWSASPTHHCLAMDN